MAWAYSSLTCGYLGDAATALTRAERAVRLSPLGADAFWLEHYLSQAHYLGHRYDEAIAWARISAVHAPGNTSNLRCLIASLVAIGGIDEARKMVQRLLQLVPAYRVAIFRARTPLRGDVRDLFAHRLHQAGVPD